MHSSIDALYGTIIIFWSSYFYYHVGIVHNIINTYKESHWKLDPFRAIIIFIKGIRLFEHLERFQPTKSSLFYSSIDVDVPKKYSVPQFSVICDSLTDLMQVYYCS